MSGPSNDNVLGANNTQQNPFQGFMTGGIPQAQVAGMNPFNGFMSGSSGALSNTAPQGISDGVMQGIGSQATGPRSYVWSGMQQPNQVPMDRNAFDMQQRQGLQAAPVPSSSMRPAITAPGQNKNYYNSQGNFDPMGMQMFQMINQRQNTVPTGGNAYASMVNPTMGTDYYNQLMRDRQSAQMAMSQNRKQAGVVAPPPTNNSWSFNGKNYSAGPAVYNKDMPGWG